MTERKSHEESIVTGCPGEELIEKLKEIMSTDEWIIDGNYGATMEMRTEQCDTVFFPDYPTAVSERLKKYSGKEIHIFTERKEAEEFLASLR